MDSAILAEKTNTNARINIFSVFLFIDYTLFIRRLLHHMTTQEYKSYEKFLIIVRKDLIKN
ncbi:unnamed protein product [marine sediment metagenome]|uniref:Uncharacterized protein n=1 Tax=marine sediment metagenome TaxID=412755 RepID=X1TFQ6_9ZZZZ